MVKEYISKSAQETALIAKEFACELIAGDIVLLKGDLGAGKTVFVKGFASALGIEENITSPTFNLIKEYLNCELPLYHMDVYRLDGNTEGVGIEDIEKAREPLYSSKLEEERAGLGFTIMEVFTDNLEVKSEVDKGTTVTMTKKYYEQAA